MAAAYLLDLTRLVSRAGFSVPSGIDRTETAYLDRLLLEPAPVFALVRTTLGFVLLDRAGASALRDRLNGQRPWGAADLTGRLSQRRNAARARAESDLRRLALGRALPARLGALLARHLPAGTCYLNTGHANLSATTFGAVHRLPGARIAVLVHDTIPLDHPELASPGMPEAFAARLRRVGAQADLAIYNSAATRADAERHFTAWGRVPPGVVAPLGVTRAAPVPSALPAGLDLSGPYFVALGTIEPRKNIGFLLDLWAELAVQETPPRLFLVGRRGWAAPELLARIDALPKDGPVHALGALPDGAAAALLAGAAGLLFPSLAEGYGLPPLEAAAAGVPVLCNDLPVYRETLGNYPVYAIVSDRYSWLKEINDLAARTEQAATRQSPVTVPGWESHFKTVLSMLC